MYPGYRIKFARKEIGLTQEDLAQEISKRIDKKVSRNAISGWETNPKTEIAAIHLLAAAKVLSKNAQWLQFGEGPSCPASNEQELPLVNANVRAIPVLSYEQAGSKMKYNKKDISYIGIDNKLAKNISINAFAMEIVGRSMAPILMPGDIIIVDPEVMPQPGEIVVTRFQQEGSKVIVGQYRPKGHTYDNTFTAFEIVPANINWPKSTIDKKALGFIVGTLVEHRSKRRVDETQADGSTSGVFYAEQGFYEELDDRTNNVSRVPLPEIIK